MSIYRNQRRSVKVKPRAITATVIGVNIHAATARCGTLHKHKPRIELPKTVVRARSVDENLGALQSHGNMWRFWGPQLFANFAADFGIVGLQDGHTKWGFGLTPSGFY
jgi:hypothetical protein